MEIITAIIALMITKRKNLRKKRNQKKGTSSSPPRDYLDSKGLTDELPIEGNTAN
jgi:hypothetical protein